MTSPGAGRADQADLLLEPVGSAPLPWRDRLVAAGALAVLVAGVSAVDPVRRAERAAQVRAVQDVVAVDFGVAEVRQGFAGDFFAAITLENAGSDLEIVESAFRADGLELLEPIGGVLPLAAGTSASLSLHLVPDCDAGAWSGTVALVVMTRTGKEQAVEHPLPAGLLAEGAEQACAQQES